MRIKSSVRKAPSVAHVYVGVGPAVTVRRRHRGLRNHNTDDFFEDALEVATLAGAENSENILPAYPSWVSAMRLFPHFFNNPYRLEKQDGLLTLQTGAKSGDGFQLWLYAAAGVLALAGAAALVILPNRRHGKREAK